MHFPNRARISRRAAIKAVAGCVGLASVSVAALAQRPKSKTKTNARPAQRAAPAGTAARDWPCFRGPNRNGVLTERLELAAGEPKQLWQSDVGNGHASLTVVKNRIYTFGNGLENLACLDAATGRPVWRKSVDTWCGDGTPSVENGRVYVLASMGMMDPPTAYCFGAADGEKLWECKLPVSTGERHYGHAGSPLLWDDLVILNAGYGAAVHKASGEVAWAHEGYPGLATPVLFQWKKRPAVAIFGGDRLVARDARTGEELWSIDWKTELAVNACDPIVFEAGGSPKVFVCSDYGKGRALFDLGANPPRRLWEFPQGSAHAFHSGFYRDGQLYCVTPQNFACLDLASGEARWEEPGNGSALLIGDTLIRTTEVGEISFARLSPTGCEELATADAGMEKIKAPPAYSSGRLFLRNEDGQIRCLQIGAGGRA